MGKTIIPTIVIDIEYVIIYRVEVELKVELLSYNQNIINIIHTACRTCYSKSSPIDIYDEDTNLECEEKKLNLIKKVMDSGHLSTTEHAYFTFAIEGVSRALLAQITRHRLCSFSVQSQRYVEIKENLDDLIILKTCGTKYDKTLLLNKYFVLECDNDLFIDSYLDSLIKYLQLTRSGYKAEDARNVLPQATKTNMVLSCNLRELMHICNLRLCKHAQLEVRTMVKKMKEEVVKREECKWLNKYLVPNCKNCTDFRDCKGIK